MIADGVARLNPMSLHGRHFLVTGAASGIGHATSVLMQALGARLSLVDQDVDGLEGICGLLAGASAPHGYPYDLRQIAGIDGLVGQVVTDHGPLHGVVHCAGMQAVVPVRTLRTETWRALFAVNTEAGLALAKSMSSKKVYAGDHGSIVFISSVMALAGSQGSVAYSMSKAALHGMTRALAIELAPRKLRVNCIAPGFVRTPMFDDTAALWEEGQQEAVEALHPLGFGKPQDIANAVAFLAADTGRWITGSVMVVDGGYLAR